MLAASTALFAILGLGFALLPGTDDEDELVSGAEEEGENLDVVAQDQEAIVPVDEFIVDSQPAEDMDASVLRDGTDDDNAEPLNEPLVEGEPSEEDALPSYILTGGPGDTLVGGPEIDCYHVTVGDAGDPETVIENMFESVPDDTLEEPGSVDRIESLLLRDRRGEPISREVLLASDLRIEEDQERTGVTLSINGHSTLFIDDVSLEDFTENSLVLANFRIFQGV